MNGFLWAAAAVAGLAVALFVYICALTMLRPNQAEGWNAPLVVLIPVAIVGGAAALLAAIGYALKLFF